MEAGNCPPLIFLSQQNNYGEKKAGTEEPVTGCKPTWSQTGLTCIITEDAFSQKVLYV